MSGVKTYCVKERKETHCVPGTEEIVMTKNRRESLRCICASCGAQKYSFIPMSKDEFNWDDFVKTGSRPPADTFERWKDHSGQYYAATGQRLFGKKVNVKKMQRDLDRLTKPKKPRKPRKSEEPTWLQILATNEYLKKNIDLNDPRFDKLMSKFQKDEMKRRAESGEPQWHQILAMNEYMKKNIDLSNTRFKQLMKKFQKETQKDKLKREIKRKARAYDKKRDEYWQKLLEATEESRKIPTDHRQFARLFQKSPNQIESTKRMKRLTNEIKDFENMYKRAQAIGANQIQLNMILKEIANLQNNLNREKLLSN